MTLEDFVNVNVRLKPAPKRKSFQHSLQVISEDPAVLLSVDKQQTFTFDNIFTEVSSQEDVYNETVKPFVEKVKKGYNSTIFAYGQTGTGKTYTMGTNPEEKDAGIISRALEDFFMSDNEQEEYDVHVSFIEIYNEKVFDLLKNDNKVPLSVKGLRIEGLSVERVYNVYEAKHFLEMGGRNRHTGETKQNMFSSRSHAIFCIHYMVHHGDKTTSARLNLVDLAGSESVKKTGTQGSSFQEGININKGLLCIGQVMTALSSNLPHVPYRQSIITTILQDSLNRNNYISLIACVKVGVEDTNESLQTLEFAQRVKRMKNKPEVNEVFMKYKADNPALFEKAKVPGTPLKRSIATPLKPNLFKKPRGPSVLSSLSIPNSIPFENSKSTVSLSSASNSEVGSNFSPVIRKYMNELENTIINKLQSVIQDTLKRPTRRSARLSVAENKENTPKFSWNQIQHKVSKLVQDEVLQLTSKTSRATSSPLDQAELVKAKRILSYSSPVSEDETSRSPVFKKPCGRPRKLNESKKMTPNVSPIEPSYPKLEKHSSGTDFTFKKPMLPTETSQHKSLKLVSHRRSARLSVKRNSILETSKSVVEEDGEKILNQNDSVSNERSFRSPNKSVRRSRRLTLAKITKECECAHKTATVVKKTKQKSPKKGSPRKERIREVLKMLNEGDKKQLQKLSTIGPKTAERILLFRHLKGNFTSVKDLAEMPGWSNTYFQNFLSQNFLNL